jgi:hypothetical protein
MNAHGEIVKLHLERNYVDIDNDTKSAFQSALINNAKEILIKYLRLSRVKNLSKDRLQVSLIFFFL